MVRKHLIEKNKSFYSNYSKKNHATIYGTHAVKAALSNINRSELTLMGTPEALQSLKTSSITLNPKSIEALKNAKQISRNEINELLPIGATHQGLLLFSNALPQPKLESLLKNINEKSGPLVALDQIKDPRNVGAIMRSSFALGARAIIIQSRNSAPISGALAKAASGALETLPFIQVTNLARALDKIKDAGYWLVGLDSRADKSIHSALSYQPVTIVLGSEEQGLRRLTSERCDILATIPTSNYHEEGISLNVSNAAAIALYQNKISQLN
jgi:23S rRNA (guanosine2251-2'-O)-methyltransferase|tara:strand:- start:159 stop:971 length:813 start_codon:yes stop_codon:yes gene_type:complete